MNLAKMKNYHWRGDKMKKQLFIFFTLFIIFIAVFFVIIHYDKNNRIDTYLKENEKILQMNYEVISKNYKVLSQSIYHTIIADNTTIAIYKQLNTTTDQNEINKLRETLKNKFMDLYIKWEALGVQQLHFHTKDYLSFLRFHAPQHYGDSLEKTRYSVKYVNDTHLPIEGFEMGKIAYGFRFVYPLFEHDKFLGSVEVSIDTKLFQSELSNSFKSNIEIIIDKNIVDKKAMNDQIKKQYHVSQLSKNYYIYKKMQDFQDPIPLDTLNKIQNNLTLDKTFSIYYKTMDTTKMITFVPIKDIQNQNTIAWLVKNSDAPYIYELTERFYTFLSLIVLFIGSIFFYLFKQNLYKQNLNENLQTIKNQKDKLSDTIKELEEKNIQISKKVQEAKEKDKLIAQQSKQASLGEMIGNIAHQWRQPLSAISSTASGLYMQNDLNILDRETLQKDLENITQKTKYLSQTIDDFRNFISGTHEKTEFKCIDVINQSLNVIDSNIRKNNIQIILDVDESLLMINYKNELIQVNINIVNNAKDALETNVQDINHRLVFINVFLKDEKINFEFIDTAGGIERNVIDRIFEPYFTTKHQSQGTGLGLYMTYKIIYENMDGDIKVENKEFEYDGINFKGAKFILKFNRGEKDV